MVELVLGAAERNECFLPLPHPSEPTRYAGPSHRIRTRSLRRHATWELACHYIDLINQLHAGRFGSRTYPRPTASASPSLLQAWTTAQSSILQEAARLAKERRAFPLTGARAVEAVTKAPYWEGYAGCKTSHTQVPLIANSIDEPDGGYAVQMLDVLPLREARFYESEANVLHTTGASTILLEGLTKQYVFIGGERAEYLKYFRRKLPAGMWEERRDGGQL